MALFGLPADRHEEQNAKGAIRDSDSGIGRAHVPVAFCRDNPDCGTASSWSDSAVTMYYKCSSQKSEIFFNAKWWQNYRTGGSKGLLSEAASSPWRGLFGRMGVLKNGNSPSYSPNDFCSSTSSATECIVSPFFVSSMNGLSSFTLKSSARQIYVESLYLWANLEL